MNKKQIYALIIIALTALVLIFNRGEAELDLIFTQVETVKALLFLIFTAIGVIIGLLLR